MGLATEGASVRACFAAWVLAVGCGCGKADGRVPVFPVTGSVVAADGKPVVGAAVCFHPVDGHPAAGLRPVGYTRADGSFDPTTYTAADGCPAGEYLVTVSIAAAGHDKPEADPDDTVRLVGPVRYADPKTTPLKATVAAGPTALPPFRLTN